MIYNQKHENMLISPARTVNGRVELFDGSTLLNTFTKNDALKEFTVIRAGDKKFFGFGVTQSIEVKLVDKDRLINIEKDNILKISYEVNNDWVYPLPIFYITDVKRDENTNELTITAQDILLYKANSTVIDLTEVDLPYTVEDILISIYTELGLDGFDIINTESRGLSLEFIDKRANLDGTETIRRLLDAIAEVTQTIYYIKRNNRIVFRGLNNYSYNEINAYMKIKKADYFTLGTQERRKLTSIVSATELGNDVQVVLNGSEGGETQYVRDNPFWDLKENIEDILDDAISACWNMYIDEFSCKWRGNYLLEPTDTFNIITKDDKEITCYLLDEKYVYNGGLSSEISWSFGENKNETFNNPSTLGEALKQTYAKVDKTNKEIELVAGETAQLKLTTDSINSSVTKIDDDLTNLTKEVKTKVTSEEVNISIETAIEDGVDRVTTTTGFTFNEEGLHINKDGSEITTSISDDGMRVYKNNNEVLVADNQGVKAEDLHATTYLVIGSNSRLEDYENNRTGCFWIGR